ncbi:MAG: HAD hydrolase family protein, partial [Phycisphaerales bacterium]|nr:HAD hydrolase family protein [Phycisphaerales bacterium]
VGSLLRHRHPVLLLKDAPSERDHYIVVGDLPLDPASEWWFKTFGVRYQRVTNVLDDPHPEDTVRVGVVATGSMLSAIAEEVRGDIGERALVQHWSAVTEEQATGSATHLLEIFDRQASKWSMVRALCRREGFDERRVVAIGDGLNDVELLANAAVGIAMENASEAVCAVADAFTGHHDRDGVAQAIDRLLNGGLSAPLA